MSAPPRECTIRRVVIAPSQIHYLRYLMEAYEGIAVVSTDDPEMGLVRLNIAPGCEEEVDQILRSEQNSLSMRSLHAVE